tara:strand:+ start:494 stop:652 length:159 start_codon:yes stop_codon:yes gene_type:complete
MDVQMAVKLLVEPEQGSAYKLCKTAETKWLVVVNSCRSCRGYANTQDIALKG